MPPQAEPSTPLLRRLNGRPQACDPCRSRKVKCDNVQPVCGICAKRGEVQKCVYTMSQRTATTPSAKENRRSGGAAAAAVAATSGPVRKKPRTGSRDGASSSSSSSLPMRPTPPESGPVTMEGSTPSERTRHTPQTPGTPLPPPGAGYLGGFTAYQTVFNEARTTLGLLDPQSFAYPPSGSVATSHRPRRPDTTFSPLAIPSTLHILRNLPSPECKTDLVHRKGHPSSLWVLIATMRVLETIRERWSHIFLRPAHERTDEMLLPIMEEINRNTTKPFDDSLADPKAFMAQFCGPDLRWESLGLIYMHRELSPDVNGSVGEEVDPAQTIVSGRRVRVIGGMGGQGVHGETWPEGGRTCLRYCIAMARRIADGNSLVVFLSVRLMVLDSLVYGDASLVNWQSHGEACALITYLGFHARPSSPNYVPCLAEEIKRRIFCFHFNIDKVGASYHGRPPMLGHRYVSTPLPLDLDDEDLLEGGERLENAVRALDADGWKKEGDVSATSVLRCRFLMAMLKDELIEVALGHDKYANVEFIKNIRARELATHNSFPFFCKYQDSDLDDLSISINALYSRLIIKLEHLQCLLFAERLIAKHGGEDEGGLLFVSFEIVRHVLVFWMNMDRYEGLRVDFLWMVMSFGAPGGGVLCMELLHPTLPRPLPYTSPSSPRITRSSIIQNLSLLVGFLGWVGPTAPNAELTMNCKTVIQSVLDYALNHPVPMQPGGGRQVGGAVNGNGDDGGGGGAQGNEGVMNMLEGLDGGVDFGFDLLGTFDWLTADDVMNFSGSQPL